MTSDNNDQRPLSGATRWWRWFLSPVLIGLWILLAIPLGGFQGKLTEVQDNDAATFLPASAESTKVLAEQERFRDTELLPAVIVYERKSGITDGDRAAITADIEQIRRAKLTNNEIAPPIDGKKVNGETRAITVTVPLVMTDDWAESAEQVKKIRELTDGTAGMRTYVTGPGGLSADFADAFGDIDGILLITAAVVVAVILLVVYRSPILPFVVLLSVMIALGIASAAIYALVHNDVIELNGQSQGILSVLVFGATTDYALLLVARYREELRRHRHAKDAMRTAFKAAAEPIIASGSTVIVGLMCLLFSDLNSNKGLGPVAAIGIASALAVSLTFLPATLALLRRGAFWPFRPAMGSEDVTHQRGLWAAIARFVGRHSRLTWAATALVLLIFAGFVTKLDTSGISQDEAFVHKPDSVKGQEVLARYFPAGQTDPAIVVAKQQHQDDVIAALHNVNGVASGADAIWVTTTTGKPDAPAKVAGGFVEINVVLSHPSDSEAARKTVPRIRDAVHKIDGAEAKVGGFAAVSYDTQRSSARDLRVIIPIVLLVIFGILALLLRALVAPAVLIATVVLSFAATLGVAALSFEYLFDHPGSAPEVTLFGFIFLVALGIDYNIFLMTRVREEALRDGTKMGTLSGLRVTGGVITSAGVVLAATFGALGVLPMVFMLQMSFIVAFGVLLDTLVVRSLLVPALTLEIGRRIWLPSKFKD